MNAALYVRVSTEEQARTGFSLPAQAEACRQKAVELGALETELFADEGVSGSILSRPGLDRLRQAVRDRWVDLVIVWDPDRLARNLSHQLLVTEEIEQANVRLEFVNFEWRHTAEGQLFYSLRGAIAQYEKEKIKERTSRGRLQKAKAGRLPTAFRPYGYAYDAETALLVPLAHEAAIVACIFDWFVGEEQSPAAIAQRLNGMGIPSRHGGCWHRNVVRQILLNRVYTGTFWANRWNTTGCSLNRHLPVEKRHRPTLRPPEDWIPIAVPKLIEPALFARAHERLTAVQGRWARTTRSEYLLSGLLLCGGCGRSMVGTRASRWGRKVRTYTCRRSGPQPACRERALPADALDQVVWPEVCTLLTRLLTIHDLEHLAPSRAADHTMRLGAVDKALARARTGRELLLRTIGQGALAPEDCLRVVTESELRVQKLMAERNDLLRRRDGAEAAPTDVRSSRLRLFLQRDLIPFQVKRALIRRLIVQVSVSDGQAEVRGYWGPPIAQAVPAGRKS